MRITEISIKLGCTLSLGDYNNVRPEVGGRAVIEPFDEADEAFAELAAFLEERLAKIADDELERAGLEPRYAQDLYKVYCSDLRQCVVVARAGIELPQESTWRDKDEWRRASRDLPSRMRYNTAHDAAIGAAHENGYGPVYIHFPSDLAQLAPLPDPGPEPAWSVKRLRRVLGRLDIPEDQWESLAALDHVDGDYLENLDDWLMRENYHGRRYGTDRIIEFIRTESVPWANGAAAAVGDDDDDDDDF